MNWRTRGSGLAVPESGNAEANFVRGIADRLQSYDTPQHASPDAPTTPDALHEWVYDTLNVWIPRERCCPHHVSPFDAFTHAYFAETPLCVWLASRGFGGKSFLLALLTLTEAITLGAAVNLLGGSGEQSQRVHSYIAGTDPNAYGKFWDSPRAPKHMLVSDPTKREMRLSNGAFVKALMASGSSVRGPHPQRLRLDECDEMDLDIFDAAMGQTMAARGVTPQTVCSSTHHKPDGTMTEILKRATDRGWPVFEWCYRENLEPHGWLAHSEVDRKKGEVPLSMWDIEYELQKPSPKTRAIDSEAVEALFDRSLGQFQGRASEVVRLVEPLHLRSFYHGTDWARDVDWTIIHTMEETSGSQPDRLAAWARHGRKPWPLMIRAYNERVEEYGGPSAHDATGVGSVCDDFLEVESMPFDFRNRKERTDMLWNYVAAIEKGTEFVYPRIDYAYLEHLYATNEDLYMPSGHLPDTMAAGALAWWAKEFGAKPYDPREWASLQR